MKRFFKPMLAAQAGLTLVELLVVVAILGLLTQLLVSSFQQHARYQALQSASSATAEWLAEIRKRAMQQNQACSIAISPASQTMKPASGNRCGNFPSLDLNSMRVGSTDIQLCYRNNDPLETTFSTVTCNSQTTNSSETLIFSPRGTNRMNAVFEFFSGTDPAKTCTLVIQPNGIIRYGTIRSGRCQASA